MEHNMSKSVMLKRGDAFKCPECDHKHSFNVEHAQVGDIVGQKTFTNCVNGKCKARLINRNIGGEDQLFSITAINTRV